jgi:replicative DNA helicase
VARSWGAFVRESETIGGPLPHSFEAERAILGAILVGSPHTPQALSSLEVSDFFSFHHRTIFRAMKHMHVQRKPTDDLVLLHGSLDETGELEDAGGIGYVSSLLDGMPRLTSIPHYVGIIRVKARLRLCAHAAEKILGLALRANGDGAWPNLANR